MGWHWQSLRVSPATYYEILGIYDKGVGLAIPVDDKMFR